MLLGPLFLLLFALSCNDGLLFLAFFCCSFDKVFVVELSIFKVLLALRVLFGAFDQLDLVVLLFGLVLDKFIGETLVSQPHLIDLLLVLAGQGNDLSGDVGD